MLIKRMQMTLAAVLLLGAPYTQSLMAQADHQIDLSAYTPTFVEDFQSINVSAYGPGTRWIAHTPWNGDFGDAAFANPVPGFPFTIKGGVFRIEARADPHGKWQSGLLASSDPNGAGFWQQYGYFEMKAKLPPGPGLWPGFWLIGNSTPGSSAELDIMEYLGHDPGKYEATAHVWPKDGHGRNFEAKYAIRVPPGSLTNGYHQYGASIDDDVIVFYLDRREVARTPTPPEFHQKMFILANLAMGSGWPIDQAPNPSLMEIAYIQAWAKR